MALHQLLRKSGWAQGAVAWAGGGVGSSRGCQGRRAAEARAAGTRGALPAVAGRRACRRRMGCCGSTSGVTSGSSRRCGRGQCHRGAGPQVSAKRECRRRRRAEGSRINATLGCPPLRKDPHAPASPPTPRPGRPLCPHTQPPAATPPRQTAPAGRGSKQTCSQGGSAGRVARRRAGAGAAPLPTEGMRRAAQCRQERRSQQPHCWSLRTLGASTVWKPNANWVSTCCSAARWAAAAASGLASPSPAAVPAAGAPCTCSSASPSRSFHSATKSAGSAQGAIRQFTGASWRIVAATVQGERDSARLAGAQQAQRAGPTRDVRKEAGRLVAHVGVQARLDGCGRAGGEGGQ